MHVCVFIFFDREGFFRLQDSWDILEKYGSTILCCEYLSAKFLHPCIWKCHIPPPKTKLQLAKRYVDIGYTSVTSLNRQVNEKILRYAGYSKLNYSTLNQVLGNIMKKICLFWSNVAASLRRALLVDAMGWNLLVR